MGLFDWTKKTAKNNVDYGKKIVGTEQIKESFSLIGGMGKKIFSPKDAIKNAKKETFNEAKSRLKVTEADIIQNYRNMVYGFYVSFFFAILCFAGTIYNLFIQKNILGALSTLAILAVCLANSFRFSLRSFQIKHQKLCSAKDWWARENEWFPELP